VLDDASAVLAAYLDHRHERLQEVGRAAQDLAEDLPLDEVTARVVETVYADVPRVLWPAAALSVRAQLEYLGRV
jgi:hypothetical protein